MKHFILSILLIGLFPAKNFSQTIVNFQMGGFASAEFTTNNFKCIGVGKGNRIWAGTQYGGLYTYDEGFNIWRKSGKLTNVFINDIKADADSGIWIAQSGTASVGGNSNIAGGVNYFPVASDISMSFYSVAGTTTSADLLSRNVRSLYIDQSWGTANNRLPRVWAAQGTYITSFNTRRGGLSIGLNPNPTYFTRYDSGYAAAPNATPISEAVGGNSQEVWIAARQNNGGSQILRFKPSGIYIGTHGTADTSLFLAGFSAQAIHFDVLGNRWIGLKAGGLIIKTGTSWLKMDAPSFFPPGTQVNYNAITSDKYGNVYIGTSNGLLQYQSRDYNSSSSPDYTPSYNYYTTNQGLPSNNITGVAFDDKNGRLLITSDAGVTFMDIREPFIKGVVFDAFCNIDNEERKYSGFEKTALKGVTTVRLLRNNVEEEFTYPDANGIFELREANDVDDYTVEIKSVIEGRTIKYIYNNIRNHTRLLPALIPDSLIRELKTFKSKMEKRCFPLKLSFGIEISNVFCTENFGNQGNDFNTSNYDAAYQEFYRTEGLTDHKKRIDNLGTYYAALAAVYKLGENSSDLVTDVVSNIFDAFDALKGFVEFRAGLNAPAEAPTFASLSKELNDGEVAYIKAFKDMLVFSITKLTTIADAKTKAIFDKSVSAINEGLDLLIEAYDKGRNDALKKALVDNLKKAVAQTIAISYYKQYYAQEHHSLFVPSASLSARNIESKYTYDQSFDNIYNPAASSVVKEAKDKLDEKKANIATLGDVAKVADIASNAADAATALSLLGGPAAAGFVKALSYTAKGIKFAAFAGSIYQAGTGASDIVDISDNIEPRAGFFRPLPPANQTILNTAQASPDSLIARKNRYNQRLTEMQVIYAAAYDSTAYKNKFRQLVKDDSLYSAEMSGTLYSLYASIDTASVRIAGFSNRLNRVIDSFVCLQNALRHSLHYQNIAFIAASDKTIYTPGLDSTANETKLANDSAVNGIISLINDINNNGIGAKAYLVQESYAINFSRAPGAAGTVTYTFKNYGGEVQNNVSFKINRPTAGYTITSADSVNVGNILPGQSKNVSFNFQSPANDSIGNYTIDLKATNGLHIPIYGLLYAIDPTKFYSVKNGNWNDPLTWSTNTVPSAINKIYITHTVTVTADANCKSVTVYKPGSVIVNSGRRIIINN
ncbi:MAG: hypothetical protein IPP72_02700 [Chitinophagaceae bacterium]|nr:hypothetical protein [Chitinophagaceae bacterium]